MESHANECVGVAQIVAPDLAPVFPDDVFLDAVSRTEQDRQQHNVSLQLGHESYCFGRSFILRCFASKSRGDLKMVKHDG